jgi:hypothetical protein
MNLCIYSYYLNPNSWCPFIARQTHVSRRHRFKLQDVSAPVPRCSVPETKDLIPMYVYTELVISCVVIH